METLWAILVGSQVVIGIIGTIISSVYAATTTDTHDLPPLPLLFAFILVSGAVSIARDSDEEMNSEAEEVTAA